MGLHKFVIYFLLICLSFLLLITRNYTHFRLFDSSFNGESCLDLNYTLSHNIGNLFWFFLGCDLSPASWGNLFLRMTFHNLHKPFHLHVFCVLLKQPFLFNVRGQREQLLVPEWESFTWFFKQRLLLHFFVHFEQDNFPMHFFHFYFVPFQHWVCDWSFGLNRKSKVSWGWMTGVQLTFINGLIGASLKSPGLCPLIPQMWVEHGSDWIQNASVTCCQFIPQIQF